MLDLAQRRPRILLRQIRMGPRPGRAGRMARPVPRGAFGARDRFRPRPKESLPHHGMWIPFRFPIRFSVFRQQSVLLTKKKGVDDAIRAGAYAMVVMFVSEKSSRLLRSRGDLSRAGNVVRAWILYSFPTWTRKIRKKRTK